jgi:hypothetical protein
MKQNKNDEVRKIKGRSPLLYPSGQKPKAREAKLQIFAIIIFRETCRLYRPIHIPDSTSAKKKAYRGLKGPTAHYAKYLKNRSGRRTRRCLVSVVLFHPPRRSTALQIFLNIGGPIWTSIFIGAAYLFSVFHGNRVPLPPVAISSPVRRCLNLPVSAHPHPSPCSSAWEAILSHRMGAETTAVRARSRSLS